MTDDERTPFDGQPDAAERAWFRTHLDPIVGSPDLDDAAGAAPERMPVAPAPAGTRVPAPAGPAATKHARRALAVAAAVAVLVGAAVVVRSSDGDAGDGTDVAAIAPEPTGWYVPVGLPDGWTLLGAEHWAGRPTCERRGIEWSDAEAGRGLGLGFDACGEVSSDEDMPSFEDIDPVLAAGLPTVEEVDLGDGTTASGPSFDGELRTSSPGVFAPDQRMLTWEGDGGVWTLRSLGLTEEELLDAARTLAADPDGVDAEAPGLGVDLDLVERWEAPARIGSPEVQLSLRSPDGRGVGLHLTLPGDGVHPAGDAVVVPEQLPGQPNEVLLFDDPSWAGRFGARWPGADLTVFRWEQDPMRFIDDDQLRTLLAALRPAGATEWRAFLSTATGEVSPPLLEAPTLASLLGVEQEAPAPPPTEPAPTDDTSPDDPAAPDDGSEDVGDPAPTTEADLVAEAELVPSDGPVDSFSDLTGLEVRLSLADAVITAQPGGGDALVLLRNRTDAPIVVNECSTLLTTWGVVPRGADGPLPRRTITDCFDNPITTVPAHGVAVVPLEWGADRGFVARSADEAIRGGLLGTLPAGAYDAVVDVPTANGTLRARVPVQVLAPACPMSDDDALRYRGLRVDDAREAAAADGLELVVVFEDGEEGGTGWDLDCTRLRAVVSGGVVDDYTFG